MVGGIFVIYPSEMAKVILNHTCINIVLWKKYFLPGLKEIPWLFQISEISLTKNQVLYIFQTPGNPDFTISVEGYWFCTTIISSYLFLYATISLSGWAVT